MTERYAHLAPRQSAGYMHLLSTVPSTPSTSGQLNPRSDPNREKLAPYWPEPQRARRVPPREPDFRGVVATTWQRNLAQRDRRRAREIASQAQRTAGGVGAESLLLP